MSPNVNGLLEPTEVICHALEATNEVIWHSLEVNTFIRRVNGLWELTEVICQALEAVNDAAVICHSLEVKVLYEGKTKYQWGYMTFIGGQHFYKESKWSFRQTLETFNDAAIICHSLEVTVLEILNCNRVK